MSYLLGGPALVVAPAPARPHPFVRAVSVALACCVGWGLLIGVAAGGLAGSLLVPVLGTAVGMIVGAIVSVAPTAATTLAVIALLAARHRPLTDPRVARRHLAWLLAGLFVALVLVAIGWAVRDLVPTDVDVTRTGALVTFWLTADAILTAWLVIWLLRLALVSILAAWARQWGWSVQWSSGVREGVASR